MIERRYWIGICCLLVALGCSSSTPEPVENAVDVRPSGVIIHEAGVTPGYVLHTPLMSDTTYLIDNDDLVVHTWKSPYAPQAFVYLRDNGHLLRGAHLESPIFKGGGSGGRLEEYTWDGELDQIVLSTPRFSEIRIIDHSTTTAEAKGSTGGRWRRGGNLLYRWGNPNTYGRHEDTPRQLFAQHDALWVPEGYPGAGHITIFNNSVPGPGDDQTYSTVVEIAPPVDADGAYIVPATEPFGPREPLRVYRAPDLESFSSVFISGAQRLPNGNTLIGEGDDGRFFEVTARGEIVWEYWSPYSGNVKNADGTPPHPVSGKYNASFRETRILPDDPALSGRDLTPLDPQPPAVVREEGEQ